KSAVIMNGSPAPPAQGLSLHVTTATASAAISARCPERRGCMRASLAGHWRKTALEPLHVVHRGRPEQRLPIGARRLAAIVGPNQFIVSQRRRVEEKVSLLLA